MKDNHKQDREPSIKAHVKDRDGYILLAVVATTPAAKALHAVCLPTSQGVAPSCGYGGADHSTGPEKSSARVAGVATASACWHESCDNGDTI